MVTLAGLSPLFFGIASAEQAKQVAGTTRLTLLRPEGVVPTAIVSGQQWDAPNGWPPLQWLGVQATHAYGRDDIANDARSRWLALNRRTYRVTGKMTEKYDVLDMSKRAGGGEYPAQDGFGWTNGVARAPSAQEAARTAPATARP
jgi:alpha,alpha-trehalase